MRISNISIENFKTLRGKQEYEFPDGIIGIVGANGQGKSTFTNAIAWALYGPLALPKKSGSANVVSWGAAKKAEVRLNFEMDGHDYQLVRTQGRSSDAHLTGALIADGSEAVTKAVETILGVDRVGFLASVFSRQLDLMGLASLSEGDRTSTVIRLKGLDRITKAVDKIGKSSGESKRSLAAIRAALPDPKPIKAYDAIIRSYEENKSRVEEELGDLIAHRDDLDVEVTSLVKKQESMAVQRKAYQKYFTAHTQLLSRVTQISETLETAQSVAAEPLPDPPAKPTRMADREKVKSLNRSVAAEREFVRNLNTTLAAKTVCPACGRAYDNAEELQAAQDRASKQVASSTKKIKRLEAELSDAEGLVAVEDAYNREYHRWETVDKFYYNQRLKTVADYTTKLETAVEELKALEPVADVSEEYDNIVHQVQQLQKEQAFVSGKVAKLEGSLDLLASSIDKTREDKATAIEMAQKVGRLEKSVVEQDLAHQLMRSFKSDQITSLIPNVALRASEFVGLLTDGKYQEVVLSPSWDIQYRYEGDGELKDFAELSVGERNVFALALRLAIADQSASNVGILVLDEVLDALDQERQQNVWGVLESLLTRFQQIFVITHVADFRDRAPFIITP